MSILKSPRAKTLLLFGSLILTSNLVGCGSGNPNEKEYFAHTPPGKPPENPNESNSERRARTRNVPKQVAAAEARNEAAAKKAAESQKKTP
jgi:hypothetical protein